MYHFLEETNIKFTIKIHDHDVWVKAMYLPADIFGSAPMFLLTTDLEENDTMSRTISHRLYDSDFLTRIAQYILLGIGGATLLDKRVGRQRGAMNQLIDMLDANPGNLDHLDQAIDNRLFGL